MMQDPITPWSQIDADFDQQENVAASKNGDARVDSGVDGARPAPDPGSRFGVEPRFMNIAPHWALVPLAGAAACLVWQTVVAAGGGTGLSALHGLGILALIVVAGALLIAAHIARRNALAGIYRAIRQNTAQTQQVFKNLPVAAELRPIWQAVQRHVTDIERHVADLLEEHRQVSLALSLADTQKRHIEEVKNSIPDPLLVTDAFDQLILANTAAGSVFGFDCKEALRKPLASVIADEKLVRMIQQAREVDTRAAHRRAEHEMGSRIYALTMSPVSPTSGSESGCESGDGPSESHGVVVLLRDITKEREATKMKSEFVARAAHELRTPLSSIRAYVEMLVDGEAADEKTREEYYNIIETSADRLGRLIDNMLNISRIEAGTVRINREPVSVAMIVKEAADVARPQAEEKGLTFTEDLTAVVYRVLADRDMLYQAVLNLLSNAIKYTPKGGRVHVRVTAHEESHVINVDVSDTGAGIPKEDLPRMFQKFFRVEANKKMAKGTGLGLNLVKHIVETIHEGKMTLTSEVDKGSTFGMVLPLLETGC
ncbi:MAG: PAS domain-containing protein [Phycisphaerae bacterium]|nr:PAS domain-containing protein [Phycisphaerae bacterium]